MRKYIASILMGTFLVVMLGVMTPTPVRADDEQNQDYNAYWQDQNESAAEQQNELNQDQQNYTQYWQEMQEQPGQ
jgi:hypothetical protein